MQKQLHQIRLAFSFLTILPIAPQKKAAKEDFARSIKYFSLVGALFALVNFLLIYFLLGKVSSWILALLIVVVNIVLSGGLHLDGLMDSFDGIAASKKSRKDTLEVLKDSRVGAFGSMAGSLVIITKIIALSQLNFNGNFALMSLFVCLVPIISRLMIVVVSIFQVDKKTSNELGSSLAIFKNKERPILDLVVNILLMKLTALFFLWRYPLTWSQLFYADLIFFAWLAIAYITYGWLKHKLKGHNGDSMGAGLELNEAIFYLSLAILLD